MHTGFSSSEHMQVNKNHCILMHIKYTTGVSHDPMQACIHVHAWGPYNYNCTTHACMQHSTP